MSRSTKPAKPYIVVFCEGESEQAYVRNIKKYLLAALYNAPTTINSYYSSLVQHDMYGDGQRGRGYAEYELNRFSVSRCRKGSRGHFRLLGGRV